MEVISVLSGPWEAKADPTDVGLERSYYLDNSEGDWIRVDIPHQWQLTPQFKGYSGVMWYRKKFSFSGSTRGRIWLVFEGVFYRADVWLNGKYLGGHSGYFYPFKFDVTKILRENNL